MTSCNHFLCVFRPIRENGPCYRTGDSAAGDGSERGAISLPESPDRTPSPRGEIRRPERGDGFFGEDIRACLSLVPLSFFFDPLFSFAVSAAGYRELDSHVFQK